MDGTTVIKIEENHYDDGCSVDLSVSRPAVTFSVPTMSHPTDECEPLEIVTTADNLVVKSKRKQSLVRRNFEELESSYLKNSLQTQSSLDQERDLASSTVKCEICSAPFRKRAALNLHLVRVHKYSSEKLNVKEFPCDMCSKFYYRRSDLELHVVEAHVVDKPHECHVCSKAFIDQDTLSKHLKSHDRQPCHVCEVCSKAFKCRKVLRGHLRVKHHRFFGCDKCKKSFSNKSELDAHSDQLQLQIQIACQICNKTFPNQCSLSVHMKFHNSTELQHQDSDFKFEKIKKDYDEFKCELCLKTFDREAYLAAHRRLVHPNSRWPCSKCSAAFRMYAEMKQHKLTHVPVKPHQCKLCDKSYSKLFNLRAHENNSHSIIQDFKCKLCPESFATSSGLRVHGRVVHRERVHPKSQKKPNKNSLRNHVDTIHCSTPRFKCKVCFKQFNFASKFKLHSRVHFNQTLPFKCEICSKKYDRRTQLNEHLVRVHKYSSEKLNVKEFPCDMCSKIYYRRSELEQHVVEAHVVDKPWECHVCCKTFIDEAALSKHLKKHDRQSIHVCDVCSEAFKQVAGLRIHLRVKHHKFFRCCKCKKSFLNKSEFETHSDIELQIQYTCQICNQTFPSQCSLSVHIEFLHSQKLQNQDADVEDEKIKNNFDEFKCKLCLKTFDRRSYIDAHRRLVHPNSQKRCSTFKTHYKMKQHEKVTHAKVKLNHCDKTYYPARHLKLHRINWPSITKRVTCPLCPESVVTSSSLRLHNRIYHRGKCQDSNCVGMLTVKAEKCETILEEFKCPLCIETFHGRDQFASHRRLVHPNSQWPCSKCARTFKFYSLLKQHELTHEELRPHECKLCGKSFRLQRALGEHEKNTHFKCQLCPESFAGTNYLKLHIANDHSGREKPFECKLCSTSWITATYLKRHTVLSHRTRKMLPCESCSKSFKTIKNLKSHVSKVHGLSGAKEQEKVWRRPEPFIVPFTAIDKVVFDEHSGLKVLPGTIAEVYNEEPLMLLTPQQSTSLSNTSIISGATESPSDTKLFHKTDCGPITIVTAVDRVDQSKSKQSPERPLRRNCEGLEPSTQKDALQKQSLFVQEFPCNMCSKMFYKKWDLERHAAETHLEHKSLKCQVCSKYFINEAALSKHLESHNRELCHICDVCCIAFNSKQILLRHLEVQHEKIFYCDQCKKSFSNESEYDAHSDVKLQIQYTCQICNKTFLSQCILTVHTKYFHSNKFQNQDSDLKSKEMKNNCAEFKCELCLRIFDREAYIVAHRRLVHSNSRWPCSKCSKTFENRHQLKLHEKATHAKVKLDHDDKTYYPPGHLKSHQINWPSNTKRVTCPPTGLSAANEQEKAKVPAEPFVFVCDHCSFKTQEDREVAAHYYHHGLPKVTLQRISNFKK